MQMPRRHLGTRPTVTTMRTGQWLPGSALGIILHSAFIVQLRPQKDITVTSRHGVSNHRRLDCLFNRLSRRTWNKNIKALRHWPLRGNPSVIGGFPSHKGRVTQKMFPFDDVIMRQRDWQPVSFFDYNRLTTSPTKRAMLPFPARRAVPGYRESRDIQIKVVFYSGTWAKIKRFKIVSIHKGNSKAASFTITAAIYWPITSHHSLMNHTSPVLILNGFHELYFVIQLSLQ